MDDPLPEADAVARYDTAMLQVMITLVAGMRRGGVLLEGLPEQFTDPHWRAEAVAEFGSWRTVLETLPAEAPPGFAGVHARLLRWAGAVGREAGRHMSELPALYAALEEAPQRLGEPSPE